MSRNKTKVNYKSGLSENTDVSQRVSVLILTKKFINKNDNEQKNFFICSDDRHIGGSVNVVQKRQGRKGYG